MSELRIIKASDGMVLTNGSVYGYTVYLGSNDSPENWYEITEEEYAEILAQREAEMDIDNLANEEDYQAALRDMGVRL